MKAIFAYSAILFIVLAASINASPFRIPTHLHSPHYRKHNFNKTTENLHGWITRLDVEKEAKAFDLRIQQEQQQSVQEHVTFSSPWLTLTWNWLSGQFTSFRPFDSHPTITTTNYTDLLPKYIAYGDSYLNNNSFGVPDPNALKGFTHYNIAFWTSTDGGSDNVAEWIKASVTQRKAIVKAYNDAGIRLGMALFGETDAPLSNGEDPYKLANRITNFVKKYNLQGVDVDFEEYDAFEQKRATKWLIPFTRQLRANLPKEQYYLSHAPIAPLFNTDSYPLGYTWVEQRIGDLIDFYNIQFYNQDDYSTCHTLLVESKGEWPNTALIQLNQVYGIPFEKMIVGKPAREQDADNGYIDPHKLAVCLANFAVPTGWKSGCMWWEYTGDLQRVLEPVKKLAGL